MVFGNQIIFCVSKDIPLRAVIYNFIEKWLFLSACSSFYHN